MAAKKVSAVQPCWRKRNFKRARSRDWRRTSLVRKTSAIARATGRTCSQRMKALSFTARWGSVERPPAMRREKPVSEVDEKEVEEVKEVKEEEDAAADGKDCAERSGKASGLKA